MKKLYRIIYSNFLVFDENKKPKLSIGGIQTYIYNIAKLIKKLGADVVVYQLADENFTACFESINTIGVKCTEKNIKKARYVSRMAIEDSNKDDIIIFADENYIINTDRKSIVIQHGVYWDKPNHRSYSSTLNKLYIFYNALCAYKKISKMETVDRIVTVDYNFLNWYRSQVAHPTVDVNVIPNFSRISDFTERNGEKVRIIFARRFFEYRGTRIFASALEKILQKYDNVEAFIAGSGPDENYLKNKFKDNSKVKFGAFGADESLEIHKNYDIAVVPTLGSEGTSLSLLEAMAAGCSVIATNVGGMTNIILDGYNGLMINPDEDELYGAMEKLINDKSLRMELSRKAYETVQKSFSHKIWEEKWKKVLEEVLHESEKQC